MSITPASADAVFSATAYHWISRQAQTDRPATILRPGGVVAIVDLIQVDSPNDAGFFAASQPIYERYGQGHTGPSAPPRDAVDPEIRALLQADHRFDSGAVRRYDWNQTYTASEYQQLMLSYSSTQMMNESDRTGLLNDMEAFIRDRFRDVITRPARGHAHNCHPYLTVSGRGKRVPKRRLAARLVSLRPIVGG